MTDDVELERLTGEATREIFAEIQVVYAAAFPGYDLGDHRSRTWRQTESPGFATITARIDGKLIGFIYGLPLGSSAAWWQGLEPPQPEAFTVETGSRTCAVIDLAVLPAHRGRGLGRRLVDAFLESRSEERATLATNPAKTEIQQMYERWGWEKVGHVPGGKGATQPVFDLYVIALR